MDITNSMRKYAECISSGAITEPTGGSWISAICIWQGSTEPLNASWLQRHCDNLGITQPVDGSWLIALANHYQRFAPLNGSWSYAIQIGCEETPIGPVILIWDQTDTEWQLEETAWAAMTAPMTPTFDQNNQTVNNVSTLTGTAVANAEVDINLNGNAYITYADALGNWSQAIALEGGADPGLEYTVTIIARDPVNGLISAEFQGLVYLLTTSKTISFNLTTYWSLYWYSNAIQVEKEITPGSWTPIEYEGNPTWVKSGTTTFYKVNPYRTGNIEAGYSADNIMAWQDGDDSGEPQAGTVVRQLELDTGFNYRIVAVPSTAGPQFANYAEYAVYDGATEILPPYRSANSTVGAVEWALGNVQQTFTL